MNLKDVNLKSVLFSILFLIIGYEIGMIVTYKIV